MSIDVHIRSAAPDEVIDLRWKLLRAGLPRETAEFEGDDEQTTRHIVAELNARVMENVAWAPRPRTADLASVGEAPTPRIVGCATFMRRALESDPGWQLRGMAVDPELQRRSVGRLMLEFAENLLRGEGYSLLLWCHARVPAKAFYERLGWQTISDIYIIPTAGPHVKMMKELSPQMKTDEHR